MTRDRSIHDRQPAAGAHHASRDAEQQIPGKQTLTQMFTPGMGTIQPKLEPGKQTLTQMLTMGPGPLQPKLALGPSADGRAPADGLAGALLPPAGGAGGVMPSALRAKMEAGFDADLSRVRLHVDETPAAIGAKAYTRGDEVHIAPQHYDAGSESGQALIGHEIAHHLQQRAGRVVVPQGKDGVVNVDPVLEAEADSAGDHVAHGRPARVSGVASSARAIGVVQPKLDETDVKAKILKINTQWDEAEKGSLEPVLTAIADYNAAESIERLQAVQAAIRRLHTAKQRKYLTVIDYLTAQIEREHDRLALTYSATIYATPGLDSEQRSIGNEELNTAIKGWLPDATDAKQVWDVISKFEDREGLLPKIGHLLEELEGIKGEEQVQGYRAFLGVYQVKKATFTRKPSLMLPLLHGVLQKGAENRTSRPKITVTGEPLVAEAGAHPTLGTSMKAVEAQYDVLARKSSAPPPHAIAEVDLALLEEMRGIPDFQAMLKPSNKPPTLTGGDGRNEKVFAMGHAQSIAFEGKLSNKGGERFYGVLMPKGWIERYGVDLRTSGVLGKSAATPTDEDFSQGQMVDGNPEKYKTVSIPSTAAFAVRAEKATPQG